MTNKIENQERFKNFHTNKTLIRCYYLGKKAMAAEWFDYRISRGCGFKFGLAPLYLRKLVSVYDKLFGEGKYDETCSSKKVQYR